MSDLQNKLQVKEKELKEAREKAGRDLAAAAAALDAKIEELEAARLALLHASSVKSQTTEGGVAPASTSANNGAKDALLKLAEGAAAENKSKLEVLHVDKRRLEAELIHARAEIEDLTTRLDRESKRLGVALNEVESLRNIMGLPPADLTSTDVDVLGYDPIVPIGNVKTFQYTEYVVFIRILKLLISQRTTSVTAYTKHLLQKSKRLARTPFNSSAR